jgi:hypothetical protein
MRRANSTRVLAGALTASLAVHAGLGVVAIQTVVGAEIGTPARFDAGPPMQLAWADEPPQPEALEEPEQDKPEEPEPITPPEPEEIDGFRLGIAKSDLDTENWIGFDQPTPHEAPRAEVEQPALEPDAGPAAAQAPPTPPVAVAAAGATGTAGQPIPPAPEQPKSEPTVEVPATQPESMREVPQPTEREPVDAGGLERNDSDAVAEEGAPQPEIDDPDRPLMVDGVGETEQLATDLRDGFVGPPFEASDAEKTSDESAIAEATPPPAPPADRPGEPGEQAPAAMAANTASPGGKPGEQSEREADATSLTEPISIRLGRPAAAEGLEIVTKRPDFSLMARVLGYPTKNPRLKVTFNREGRVRTAVFLDPTGLSDIDSPTLHAVYRWTARGEALNRLPKDDPEAGLSITVTILLR